MPTIRRSMTSRAILDRVLSSPYSLKESDDRYAEYRKEINEIFDRYSTDGRLAVPTETVAYIGGIGNMSKNRADDSGRQERVGERMSDVKCPNEGGACLYGEVIMG